VREVKQERVIERVYEPVRLRLAWRQVRSNAGAAGIDGMTVKAFERREEEHLEFIREKLKSGTYRFRPARRVMIPKEGTSKLRKLGYPW
jgi:RNA-directed DNA polymerase